MAVSLLNFRISDPTWDLWDLEVYSIGYLFNHDFNDALSFRQNLRYINQNLNARRTWHNQPLKSDQRTLNRFAIQDREDSYSWAIDNQLQWKLTTGTINHTLLTGVDYFKGSNNGYTAFGSAPSLDLFAPVYNQIFPPPTTVSLGTQRKYAKNRHLYAGSNQDWRLVSAYWRAL